MNRAVRPSPSRRPSRLPGRLEGSNHGRSNSQDGPSAGYRGIHEALRLRRDRIGLFVHRVVFDVFGPDGLKGSQPDVQCDPRDLRSPGPKLVQELRREMQPRGGGGRGSQGSRIHRLVPFLVSSQVRPLDVRREGDVAVSLEPRLVDGGSEPENRLSPSERSRTPVTPSGNSNAAPGLSLPALPAIVSHTSPLFLSSRTNSAVFPSARLPNRRAFRTRVSLRTMRVPGSTQRASSRTAECDTAPDARSRTSSRAASRSTGGAWAIWSSGSSKEN